MFLISNRTVALQLRHQTRLLSTLGISGLTSVQGPSVEQQLLGAEKLGEPKHITVMAGVHGNELAGIEIVSRLIKDVEQITPRVPGSRISLVFGNEKAIAIGKRGSSDGADLNRCFNPDDLNKEPSNYQSDAYERTRARELKPLLDTTDVLLDLHSTNQPSPWFVRVGGSLPMPAHCDVSSYLFPYSEELGATKLRFVADPNTILGGRVVTTDEYVNSRGGVGICFESGLASDVSQVDDLYNRVRLILNHVVGSPLTDEQEVFRREHRLRLPVIVPETFFGMEGKALDGPLVYPTSYPQAFRPFVISKAHILKHANWHWEKNTVPENFEYFRSKAAVGRYVSEADGIETVTMGENRTHILFPKDRSLQMVGKPLFWQVKQVPLTRHYRGFKRLDVDKLTDVRRAKTTLTRMQNVNHREFFAFFEEKGYMFYPTSSSKMMQLRLASELEDKPLPKKIVARAKTVGENVSSKRMTMMLRAFNKYVKLLEKGKVDSPAPKMLQENFLYFPEDSETSYPIVVYPTVYREQESWSTLVEPPFTSPRILFTFPLHRAMLNKRNMFMLGIARSEDTDLPELITELLDANQQYKHVPKSKSNGVIVDYVGFPLTETGTIRFSPDQVAEVYLEAFGQDKDDVGETYSHLARIMECFGKVKRSTPVMSCPVFDVTTGNQVFTPKVPLKVYW